MIRLRTIAAMLLGSAAFMAKADGRGIWLEQKHDFGAFDEDLGHCLL